MTRTIDATLTAALAAGTGIPFLKAYIGYSNGAVIWSGACLRYRLTGQTLELEVPYVDDLGSVSASIWLERGLTIAGTNYTTTTGRFRILSQHYLPNGRQIVRGALFPMQYYTANAYQTYKQVIDALCTNFGKTAVYKDAGAAWLNYRFMPYGTFLQLNDPNSLAPLLQQKWLIFYCDIGSEQVLFYSCDGSLAVAADWSLTATDDFYKETSNTKNRYLVWTDEYGTIHTAGSSADPIHNLGYLESTAAAPARKSPGMIMQAIIRPDFRIVDGDIFALTSLGGQSLGFALVTEQYAAPDKPHKPPRWSTTLDCNQIFDNTPGGSIPSAIERAVNYIPVNTSMFNSILTAQTNNLQAALDRIDDSFAYGRWTPTLTNVALINVAGSTVYPCMYSRVGDVVTVSGLIVLTTTGAGTAQANITPPIPTNFVNTEDADGNITQPGATYGSVIADTVNDRLQLVFTSAAATTYWLRFVAMYRLQ